jgi:hypothetical protein
MAAKKTVKARKSISAGEADEESAQGPRVFAQRPTRTEALAEVEAFFDLLKEGKVKDAGARIAHKHKDWFPDQVRSLWQDLVGPWLEENDEEFDLDDDSSWRKYKWCTKMDVDLDPEWDGKSDEFYLTLDYDGETTDVSAEFSIVKRKEGWLVQREIMHIA